MKKNMNRENAAAIMTRAHKMTRATVKAYPGADYRVTLSAALRICWKENGRTAPEIWAGMTGEEQAATLWAVTLAEYRRRDALTDKEGRPLPNYFEYVRAADDLEAVRNSAWIRIVELLERDGERPRGLGWYYTAAVRRAAVALGRAEKRNARALKYDQLDGAARAYIVDNAAPIAEPIAPAPEVYAATREALEMYARDEKDRAIIALTGAGLTLREIAPAAGMTFKAVHKRLERIRREYREDRREA